MLLTFKKSCHIEVRGGGKVEIPFCTLLEDFLGCIRTSCHRCVEFIFKTVLHQLNNTPKTIFFSSRSKQYSVYHVKVRASSCSYLKYTLIPINMRVDKSEGAYLKSFPNEIITLHVHVHDFIGLTHAMNEFAARFVYRMSLSPVLISVRYKFNIPK